jgi:hypothetical protein
MASVAMQFARAVMRYYKQITHADWHRQIEESPNDTGMGLRYAAWLETHGGMPVLADIVRRHVDPPSEYGSAGSAAMIRSTSSDGNPLPGPEVNVNQVKSRGTGLTMFNYAMPSHSGSGKILQWNVHAAPAVAANLIRKAVVEGANLGSRISQSGAESLMRQNPPRPQQMSRPRRLARPGTPAYTALHLLSHPDSHDLRSGHGDMQTRKEMADSLDDTGEHHPDEGELLRTPGQHVVVHNGAVVPARWNTFAMDRRTDVLNEQLNNGFGYHVDRREGINPGGSYNRLHMEPSPQSPGTMNIEHGFSLENEPWLEHAPYHEAHNRAADAFQEAWEQHTHRRTRRILEAERQELIRAPHLRTGPLPHNGFSNAEFQENIRQLRNSPPVSEHDINHPSYQAIVEHHGIA